MTEKKTCPRCAKASDCENPCDACELCLGKGPDDLPAPCANGVDPNDNSPATVARRASAALASFHGATFLATLEIERGGKRPDGTGNFRDKNVIGKILRVGDQGYRRLEQPAPQPIERSALPQPQTSAAPGGTPAMAAPAIARPTWAE